MQRPFLSSPAARPMRFGKVRPAIVTGSSTRRCATAQTSGVRWIAASAAEGQVVRVLRIEPEQERSGEGVGKERHGGRRFWHRRCILSRHGPLAADRQPDMTEQRIEKDTFGDIAVAADRLWGAQTQRSLHHFDISTERMPPELIRALALVKRSAAVVNRALGTLDPRRPTRSSPPPTRCSPAGTTASSRSRSGRPARARRPT